MNALIWTVGIAPHLHVLSTLLACFTVTVLASE